VTLVERPALEQRIHASLDAGRIPVLLGGCGTGRSALLHRVAARRDGARFLDLAAVATTPERAFTAVTQELPPPGVSARGAFDALMDRLAPRGAAGPLHLFDEFQELRTFENFPGLRDVQRDFIARLAESEAPAVLTSRFTARAHRLLRDAPARFEVIHLPPLDLAEVEALARARDGRPEWARRVAGSVLALSAGRPAYAAALVDALAGAASIETETALADLLAPDGRVTALCRFSYEFRLHRARGYGALKAILGVLAEEEPLTLTDIAHRLSRTPGSTKDYLSWLEDVDVLAVARKRYTFDDPLVRLFVRLYTKPEPPSASRIADEVRAFAEGRPTDAIPAPAVVAPGAAPATDAAEHRPAAAPQPAASGAIIEID
jgi:hypothetical protein